MTEKLIINESTFDSIFVEYLHENEFVDTQSDEFKSQLYTMINTFRHETNPKSKEEIIKKIHEFASKLVIMSNSTYIFY